MAQYNPITGITSYAPTADELGAEPMAAASVDTAPVAPAAPAPAAPGMFSAPAPEWYWDESANHWRGIADNEQMLAPDAVFNGIRKFTPEIRDEDGRVQPRDGFGGGNPAYLQMVWDSTPGNSAAKLNAVAATGVGLPSAIQWLQQAGVPMTQADVDAIMNSGEMIAFQQHMGSRRGGLFGGLLKPVFDIAADLDFTGITGLALGEANPGGILGLHLDPLAELTGTRPEELAMIGRMGASTLNPVVGLGLQAAPGVAGNAEFDPRQIAQNTAISAGTGAALGYAAPYASGWIDDIKKFFGEMDFNLDPADAEQIYSAALDSASALPEYETLPGMSMPAAIPEIDGTFGGLTKTGMMSPATVEPDPTFGGALTETAPGVFSADVPGPTLMPAATAEPDPTFGGALAPTDIGVYDAAAASDPAAPTVSPEQLKKYAKIAQSLYRALGSESPGGVPEGAPQQEEGVTDEQYAQQLVEYANLDAEAMAAQGFVPGTQQYYEHIMGQMDSVIHQVLEGMDVDSDDLAQQLRTKTDEELRALERALFVRGQMEQLMRSGTYTDPATGLDEEVIGEGMFNPGRAAYQRGLARNVNDLGRLRGADARKFLGDLTNRDVDFYGMQERADERALDEQYLLEDDLKRRRRGMFGGL